MENLISKVLEFGMGNVIDKSRDPLLMNDEIYKQDCEDLAELENRYNALNLDKHDKMIIDDYMACFSSMNTRAWAYGESILDLRVLMKAKKVPLVKTAENWQLQLSNLYKLASGELTGGEGEFQEGITYEEYLKALLLAEENPTLCMRSLDLLELNTGIRADTCLTELEIESTCQLRGGITYTFVTNYKYE